MRCARDRAFVEFLGCLGLGGGVSSSFSDSSGVGTCDRCPDWSPLDSWFSPCILKAAFPAFDVSVSMATAVDLRQNR